MKLIKRDYDKSYYNNFLTRESPNSPRNQARLRVLLARQAGGPLPGARLLEVGCGSGGFLLLAEAHYEVEGIDISHAAIAALQPHFGQRVSLLNIEQRPLAHGGYNAIAAFNILEHLRQPHKAVDKLYRALAPGGLLFGSVPNNFGPVGSAATLLSNIFDRTHVSTFNPSTWERIFRHVGFSAIDFFGELTIGRNRARYLRGRFWPYLSFNLMFICSKS
jgi:2-polyprenyl-3-methyl-5-hydroxy-6-metoxy-1,4-benzoquinol methylase